MQLVRALDAHEEKHGERSLPALANQPRPDTGTVPLVRLSRETHRNGMLNERQRTWAAELPNETSVENPVFQKWVQFHSVTNDLLCNIRYNLDASDAVKEEHRISGSTLMM